MSETMAALAARVEALTEALYPFAKIYVPHTWKDDRLIETRVTTGQIRAARAAMEDTQ